MSETLDYPGDTPTGPQAAVLPETARQQGPPRQAQQAPPSIPPSIPQSYAFRPGAPMPPQAPQPKPNRLNKVAAGVCIAAGSLVIVAVLFGGGFYLGRETAPVPRPDERSSARVEPGGPMIIPMPRGQFDPSGPGIVIPNGPTFQLPNIFPQLPTSPQLPSSQTPGQPPR